MCIRDRHGEMPLYVYLNLLNQYGFKKIADQKFAILVLSVRKHIKVLRVNIFARMLELFDTRLNYGVEEVKKYLEAFDYLGGVNSDPYEMRYLVPLSKALEFIKQIAGKDTSDFTELRTDIEALREVDSKKQPVVDMDVYLSHILEKYRLIVNKTKAFVGNAFAAADLDANGMITLHEFLLLFRHIESENFDKEQAVGLFQRYCDVFHEDEMNLSFDKFSFLCVENHLFSDQQQDLFLQLSKKEDVKALGQTTAERWEVTKTDFEIRLRQITILDRKELQNWTKILEVLDSRIHKLHEMDPKPILIAVKIMDLETKRILREPVSYTHLTLPTIYSV
eukprot:TRINITY_DN22610_c0_g1_i1.p1 TRINITY_DN22610_c0_g1~~TRINITY_DN22610_c0_g1_i1.p1  ORF type:complete len:350 (-),score=98.23 TRINITY_DN22610_c0_g1_i1:15-1022(-)